MRLEKKDTCSIQLKDCTEQFFYNFYSKQENYFKVIMVFDENVYVGSLYVGKGWGRWEYQYHYGNTSLHVMSRKEVTLARKFLLSGLGIIPVNPQKNVEQQFFFVDGVRKDIFLNDTLNQLEKIKRLGVEVCIVKAGEESSLRRKHKNTPCSPSIEAFWKYRDNITNWNKMSRQAISEAESEIRKKQLSNRIGNGGVNRLFLVGPCIVGGSENPSGEELASVLYRKLYELGINYEIIVVFRGIWMETLVQNKIFEYDIRKNDLVIFFIDNEAECKADFVIAESFNHYMGDKWLYYDMIWHTTVFGNEMIADMLLKQWIVSVYQKSVCKGGTDILHQAEQQFSFAMLEQIGEYCNGIRAFYGDSIGAIVMNCNPFTLGHRYLIEQALKEVDGLYLFVVEEDLSEIPYKDRIRMVQLGTNDLERVRVVASGKFMISRDTFRNYFEKENMQTEKIDAARDIYIFAKCIAKELNITKRFVGEEPIDRVTEQYNRQMEEILPQYGVELVEIPRMHLGAEIISASRVRQLMKFSGGWNQIQGYVPKTVFQYLLSHASGWKHGKKNDSHRICVEEKVQPLLSYIYEKECVIIYGLGENANILLSYVPDICKDSLIFCDKKAQITEIDFMGKKVISPELLQTEYKQVPILVSSSRYAYEIYKEFKELGILNNREVVFNNWRLECF